MCECVLFYKKRPSLYKVIAVIFCKEECSPNQHRQGNQDDTWLGVPFSDADAVELAEACGFEPRYRLGAGTQYFWLWFFKR